MVRRGSWRGVEVAGEEERARRRERGGEREVVVGLYQIQVRHVTVDELRREGSAFTLLPEYW